MRTLNAGGVNGYANWHTGPFWRCSCGCYCPSVNEGLALASEALRILTRL